MNNLEPQDRLYTYEGMLDILLAHKDANTGSGFCAALNKLIRIDSEIKHNNIKQLLELYEYKPTGLCNYYGDYDANINLRAYWFHPRDVQRRIDILSEIINKLKLQITITNQNKMISYRD